MSDEVPAWQRKLDHRLRALWARIPESERARQSVRVLLRFAGTLDRLKEVGAQIHSVSGDIASGAIAVGDLPRIAIASEVLFIEMAQPLALDA